MAGRGALVPRPADEAVPGTTAILVVRDPEARGWPERGETTASKRDAMRWVDAYVDRLGDGWFTGGVTLRTVAEVAKSYLAELEESAPPNTIINRKSNLDRHVVPAFGDQPVTGRAECTRGGRFKVYHPGGAGEGRQRRRGAARTRGVRHAQFCCDGTSCRQLKWGKSRPPGQRAGRPPEPLRTPARGVGSCVPA